jgi:hypothetical protein
VTDTAHEAAMKELFQHLVQIHYTLVDGYNLRLIDDDGLKAIHDKLHVGSAAEDPLYAVLDDTPAIQAAIDAIPKPGWKKGYGPSGEPQ